MLDVGKLRQLLLVVVLCESLLEVSHVVPRATIPSEILVLVLASTWHANSGRVVLAFVRYLLVVILGVKIYTVATSVRTREVARFDDKLEATLELLVKWQHVQVRDGQRTLWTQSLRGGFLRAVHRPGIVPS
jgi:hypothetical protein